MKYYSEKLNKMFTNEADLHNAERALVVREQEKQQQALDRKNDACRVEEAFKKLNVAKKAYHDKANVAVKTYQEAIKNAKLAYDTSIEGVEHDLNVAKANYNTELKAFTDKHKDGYHLTLTDKDAGRTETISGVGSDLVNEANHSVVDSLFDLLNSFRLF